MQHQVSHGDSNHDPFKYTDEELAYLYAQQPPTHPLPVSVGLPTSPWVDDFIRLLST